MDPNSGTQTRTHFLSKGLPNQEGHLGSGFEAEGLGFKVGVKGSCGHFEDSCFKGYHLSN